MFSFVLVGRVRIRVAVVNLRRMVITALTDPYRPEAHYMRGPGPKWRQKHAASTERYLQMTRARTNCSELAVHLRTFPLAVPAGQRLRNKSGRSFQGLCSHVEEICAIG
jgi:hypothetical protein